MKFDRRIFLASAAAMGANVFAPMIAKAQTAGGAPIKVGGSLALTGPLAATGMTHKLAGEIYVESLNRRGGLLGRPVEWVLKDDQSRPDLARTLYEQLINDDKVDILIGPYGTGGILSAMGVAQRYGKTIVHHTFGIPSLATYDQQFPAWALGTDPQTTIPNNLLDALAASPRPPKTIAVLTSKFPSVQFVAAGAREVAKKRGLQEVLFLEWEFGNREFGPIAGRIKDADPDLIFVGGLGLDANQLLDAMRKIDYKPRHHFYLYPAPGPLLKTPDGNRALSVTIFEDHPPFNSNPVAAEFVKTFSERAKKANLPDSSVETQAAASFVAWQIIEAGVVGAKTVDNKAVAAWLKKSQVDTIEGKLRFNERGNFGSDLTRIKQVQDGKWLTVWPAEWAAPGAKLRADWPAKP